MILKVVHCLKCDNLYGEKNKFIVKFGNLNSERAASARLQRINREILSNTSTI